MQKISSMGSERATNDSGKIITCHGRTHIAWQDVSREGYFNRVRTYDHAMGSWGEPVTLDEGIDNHARGVLAYIVTISSQYVRQCPEAQACK